MSDFQCPYLNATVELTEEREAHIRDRHPDLLPAYRERIAPVLADPDRIYRSGRFGGARLFVRWYTDIGNGKNIVVVVVSELGTAERHWIITAYLTSRLTEGDPEWTRS
jgi:hypothetical protein